MALSTPHLQRLDQSESPLSRYAGRRVTRIDMSPTTNNSNGNTPPPPQAPYSPSSTTSRARSARALRLDSPVMKRSRSTEHSEDDDFALAVAGDGDLPSPAVRDDPAHASTRSSDRFIPSRAHFDVDVANYNLRLDNSTTAGPLDTSPAKEQYKLTLNAQLFGGRALHNVLSVNEHSSDLVPSPYSYPMRLLDATSMRQAPGSPQKKCHRVISRMPWRILDAPDMIEDYYLNLLDWSRNNVIAVGLHRSVYLWSAACGDVTKLFELEDSDACISSVRWTENGDHLAVGTSECDVQLFDATTLKRVRRMRGHSGRVSVLAWHGNRLASGARDSQVHIRDVRSANSTIQTLSKHTQEVCGLAWSSDGILASGSNDNLINLWEPARTVTPRHTLAHHAAAVKGLAWCPWQSNLLASGGGTADRTIRFWDSSSGSCLNAIDTKSQVCAILWSTHYRELVSSHGFSQNQLIVWQYPSMVKACELTGHTSRVLHLAMSPDGETVVSASGDETLRFWRIFERRRPSVTVSAAEQRATELALPSMSIR